MSLFPSRLACLPLVGFVAVFAGCGASSSSGVSTPTPKSAAAVTTPSTLPTQPVPPTATISGGSTALTVNGQKVPMTTFKSLFGFMQRRYVGVPAMTKQRIATSVQQQLVAQELTRQYAAKHGISVSASDMNAVMRQQEAGPGGAAGFKANLANYGLTLNSFKQLVEPSLLEQKVAQRLYPTKNVMVPQARVRHILIGTTSQGKKTRSDAAAKALAHTVLGKLQRGGNFKKLALQYSDDPGKTQNGGYYTVHPGDQMVPQFLNAAFHQPVGKPTIVKSMYGYHVFEVVSRGKGPASAQQQQQIQQQHFSAWIAKQQAHTKIQRMVVVK